MGPRMPRCQAAHCLGKRVIDCVIRLTVGWENRLAIRSSLGVFVFGCFGTFQFNFQDMRSGGVVGKSRA